MTDTGPVDILSSGYQENDAEKFSMCTRALRIVL